MHGKPNVPNEKEEKTLHVAASYVTDTLNIFKAL